MHVDLLEQPDSDYEDVVQEYINAIGTDIVPPIDEMEQLNFD